VPPTKQPTVKVVVICIEKLELRVLYVVDACQTADGGTGSSLIESFATRKPIRGDGHYHFLAALSSCFLFCLEVVCVNIYCMTSGPLLYYHKH
jgi:hypothetical protein